MTPFNRQWWTALLAAACLSLPADVALGQSDEPARPAGRQRQAATDQGDTGGDQGLAVPLRMRFEVIELTLSPEQIRQINASTEFVDFQGLATEGIKSGQAQVKHAFDAMVRVGWRSRLVSGTRVPLLTSRTSTKEGKASTGVSHEDVGCVVWTRAIWPNAQDQTRLSVSWKIEVSEVHRDGSVMLTDDLAAPTFQEVSQELETVMQVGTDAWFSSLSSHRDNADGEAKTRAYVYHARFDRPDDR